MDELDWLAACAVRFGPVVRLEAGSWLVTELSAVDDILHRTHREFVVDRRVGDAGRFWGDGIPVAAGEKWLRNRRRVHPAFDPAHVAAYASAIVDRTMRAVDAWESARPRDVFADLQRLTLEIASETVLGLDGPGCPTEVEDALTSVITLLDNHYLLAADIRTPEKDRFFAAHRRLDEYVHARIARERSSPGVRPCLLSTLVATPGATDDEIRDELVTTLRAAHKNTSTTLAWALYLLAANPEHQYRAAREISRAIGTRAPAFDDAAELGPVTDVVSETLRLYPLYPVITRFAAEDTDVAAYRARAGTRLIVGAWLSHRDRRWFDAPEQFRPQRWADGLASRLPRSVYLPFGGGPRMCNASHYALTEATLVLATILSRVHLALPPDGSRPRARLTPNGLRPARGVVLVPASR